MLRVVGGLFFILLLGTLGYLKLDHMAHARGREEQQVLIYELQRILRFHHSTRQHFSSLLTDFELKKKNDSPSFCHSQIKAMLHRYYSEVKPEKIGDIDKMAYKYVGRKAELNKRLLKKYGIDPKDFR